MTTTLWIAAIFCTLVFAGNAWYCHKNKQPHNWKRGLVMAGISAAIILTLGYITE
jgi:hypothetical protein